MLADFGKTAEDYSKHRAGFPEAFFNRMAGLGIGQPGQRLLDLGTGTGTLARGFAQRDCQVTALDPSEPMVAQAKQLDREAGVTVHYVIAKAEETQLPAHTFDVVTAGQCWHWFDRPKAAREVCRLLISGGRLVIAHFDWIPFCR